MSVDVSVIICTLNRKDLLRATLESLQSLKTADRPTHEILVIDNGSSDGTSEMVRDFVRLDSQKYGYHFEPKRGKSTALNSGILHASGKILAFTDDDVIVDENWIQVLWDTFVERKEIIAVQGRILLQKEIERLPPWADPKDLLFCCYYSPGPTPFYGAIVAGANMAFRKEAFEKYGMFDPRLGPGASALGEETEFGMRLKDTGEKVVYQPEALVFHRYDERRFTWEYWDNRLKQHAHSCAVIDVQVRHKKINRFTNYRKLAHHYVKYFIYSLMRNQHKKYKYDRRIRYQRSYIKSVSELQTV